MADGRASAAPPPPPASTGCQARWRTSGPNRRSGRSGPSSPRGAGAGTGAARRGLRWAAASGSKEEVGDDGGDGEAAATGEVGNAGTVPEPVPEPSLAGEVGVGSAAVIFAKPVRTAGKLYSGAIFQKCDRPMKLTWACVKFYHVTTDQSCLRKPDACLASGFQETATARNLCVLSRVPGALPQKSPCRSVRAKKMGRGISVACGCGCAWVWVGGP